MLNSAQTTKRIGNISTMQWTITVKVYRTIQPPKEDETLNDFIIIETHKQPTERRQNRGKMLQEEGHGTSHFLKLEKTRRHTPTIHTHRLCTKMNNLSREVQKAPLLPKLESFKSNFT